MTLVALDRAGMVYRSPVPFTALADATLRIDAGETVAVVGPSGSGKTTLLSILGGLERPTTGSVHFAGHDLSALADGEIAALRAFGIGFVFQRFHLIEHLTVLENVATGLLYRGRPAAERRATARVALERVGLGPRVDERVTHLSGGERQRVAIARAVSGSPRLVLADEPTGNLDSVNGRAVMELLVSLADEETAVVVVTHDPRVAAGLARTVAVVDGRIVSDTGAPR
ncbi:ABC transporter ATP-binding protein [Leifsonia sp. EB34]|uniref:ABC transporter ATP-binding protein n=1 Tax=Leifsonia sp. EB34 TaxID=3156303 RepID=UPI003512BEEB